MPDPIAPNAPQPTTSRKPRTGKVFDAIDAIGGDAPAKPPAAPVASAPEATRTARVDVPVDLPAEPVKGSPKAAEADPDHDKEFDALLKPKVKNGEPEKPATIDWSTAPAALRTAYEEAANNAKHLKEQLARVESSARESSKAEVDLAKTELAQAKTQMAKLDDQLKLVNYERSDEFDAKFNKPWQQAMLAAQEDISGSKIVLADGMTRPATMEDLLALATIKDGGTARARARELFGDDASIVLGHRQKLIEIARSKHAAVEDWKQNGTKRLEAMQAEQQREMEEVVGVFDGAISSLEANPVFDSPSDDAEISKYLTAGKRLINRAFRGEGIPEELSVTERRRRIAMDQAQVAVRAVHWAKERAKNDRLTARIAELESKLKAFEASVPGSGDVPAEKKSSKKKSIYDKIDEIGSGT